MAMWPIFTRVNSPDNDDPSLLHRSVDTFEMWAPLHKEGSAWPALNSRRRWRAFCKAVCCSSRGYLF